jgi:hypothetical protein
MEIHTPSYGLKFGQDEYGSTVIIFFSQNPSSSDIILKKKQLIHLFVFTVFPPLAL